MTKTFVVCFSLLVFVLLVCAIFKITGHLDQMTEYIKLKLVSVLWDLNYQPFIETWHERYKNKKTFLL